ncbi:MAG: hypothetical protein KatS3mg104_2052 [Phycisphaerae bacterium]|nr:MAG: hypothetical protein KatS3mg104_2052 [Phycisphaerae bacterium]
MTRIFIGVCLLSSLIITGCDKEIKEAVKPAPVLDAPVPSHA